MNTILLVAKFVGRRQIGAIKLTKYIFPVSLIGIDLCAAAVYLFNGDVKKTVYWIAAAILNICVTFQEVIFMIWYVMKFLLHWGVLSCGVVCLMIILRDRKCQKLWNKEKAMRMKANPKISRAELCEYFVMFCLRNDCKVNF